MSVKKNPPKNYTETIRVRGIVQGVGFRPTVWKYAHELSLTGRVWNDAEGVLIQAWGSKKAIDQLVERLDSEPPPLARISTIDRQATDAYLECPNSFEIDSSQKGQVNTDISPDTATCDRCRDDVFDLTNRRFGYPFTNCTHCGPRLSIIQSVPYDREHTSMSDFPLCAACQKEYTDPADRRFHAQPNACAVCGPEIWLENPQGERLVFDNSEDVISKARALLREGKIVAIKGIGGIHLACNASDEMAVTELRQRKCRYGKAFALMAEDSHQVSQFALLTEDDKALLQSSAAPIVILEAQGTSVANGIAPGQRTLGFMLPYTPLHHLLMRGLGFPIVLTSGNRSDEPQSIANDEAKSRLHSIADYYLLHNRVIENRLDDSVVRMVAGRPRFLRRARGYAPAPLSLPLGFEQRPSVLAMGSELKNTFCLLQNDKAILSQHMGDLENAPTFQDYKKNLALYLNLFDHPLQLIAIDKHPDYLSSQWGRKMAEERGVPLIEVQHHHAHIASCMAENGHALEAKPVLGIALDGLGYGDDDTIWGGEFLLADYKSYKRLARFKPTPMLGGTKAMYEPWRNTYASLVMAMGWDKVCQKYAHLSIVKYLNKQPLSILDQMMTKGLNSPLSSSCGRLFDAVAAAVGLCRESVAYEGQAAIELESVATIAFKDQAPHAYPYLLEEECGMHVLGFQPMWVFLLNDLSSNLDVSIIAARFHQGIAQAVAHTALNLCDREQLTTVALSGGVFQNKLILEVVIEILSRGGLEVLTPVKVSANDSGLSLGQAVIGAATGL